MSGGPSLGEILAVAFAPPPIEPLLAECIAGRALAAHAANFYGVDYDEAWQYVCRVPTVALAGLLTPEGWGLFGAAIAEGCGLASERLPVTVH